MLMSILLMRDELSYSRFSHRPFEAFASNAAQGKGSSLSLSTTENANLVGAASASVMHAAHVIGSLSRSFSTRRPPANDQAQLDKSPSFSAKSKTSAARTSGSFAAAGGAASPLAPVVEDAFDCSKMADLSLTDPKFWAQHRIHCEGGDDSPFKVRGPSYLKDKKKVEAGDSAFTLGSIDLVSVGSTAVEHISRFLPSVRSSGLPYAIVINLVVPGSPCLSLAASFVAPIKSEKLTQQPPADPMGGNHDWSPFDFVLHKFVNGTKEVRDKMLKMIPNVADGSWLIKSAVGNTPVILGKALKTIYSQTEKYLEVTIDISANKAANYVTGQVRSCTKSLVVDMGFVLEGTEAWELPEALLGGMRMYHLDLSNLKTLDMSKELALV